MRKLLILACLMLLCAAIVHAHDDEEHDTDDHDVIDVSGAVAPDNPTYYEHIKPLLELHCNTCHSEGQIVGDIPLTDPDDVVEAASDIAFNASIGYMPPWLPSSLTLPMQHNRSLSDVEIATLIAWDEMGTPLGEPDAYVSPIDDAYQLPEIRADLTLIAEEPYVPDETAQDDYRCFAVPLDIDTPQFVTGYEFLPEIAEMAHHGIVYRVGESAQAAIDRRNYEDGQVGWSCYGGVGLNSRNEMIGTWAPGTLPTLYPNDTGFKLEPGDSLIIQMHYNLIITREPDQTQVNLQFADAGTEVAELMTQQLTAPVEIPCPAGVDGSQCERMTALDRLARLYGDEFHYFPDSLLQDCGQTLTTYANNTGEDAIGYCDYPIPTSLTVFGVFGHMHELGRSFTLELNPDGDDPQYMLDIPKWDFDWQDSYYFVEPLQLNRGDVMRMTCNWDNTKSENPRYVVWGEGTEDEMCFGAVITLRP